MSKDNDGRQAIERQALQDLWLRRLREQGTMNFRVVGESMSPLIDLGDRVSVGRVLDPNQVVPGDIVLFTSGKRLIAHRLIQRVVEGGDLYFRQAGDAYIGSSLIKADQIVGVVTRIEKPGYGIVINTARQRFSSYLLSRVLMVVDRLYAATRRFRTRWMSSNTRRLPGKLSRAAWAVLRRSHKAALVTFLALDGAEGKAKVTGARVLRRQA